MTIDEFEDWISGYPAYGWELYMEAQFGADMIKLLEFLSSRGYYNTVNIIKHEIKDELNKVEPIEDRDFLTLKYSQLLTIDFSRPIHPVKI